LPQVLEAVLKDKDDKTCMSLIYANNVSPAGQFGTMNHCMSYLIASKDEKG